MNEVHKLMDEYIGGIPARFRADAEDVFCDRNNSEMWNLKTVRKAWEYFLADILDDMTEKEKSDYFGGDSEWIIMRLEI